MAVRSYLALLGSGLKGDSACEGLEAAAPYRARRVRVRGFDGLDAATARIADELSKQYYLGYASSGEKDGRWHAIRVEVRDRRLTVRARRGYVAS